MSKVADRESGAAPVEFVLVGSLVIVLLLGVVQLALAQHVRSTLVHAAAEGARLGSRVDRAPQDAVVRAKSLISDSVAERYAQDVTVRADVRDGLAVLVVEVRAPLPVIGLLGPAGAVTVSAHALQETE